MDIHDIYEKSRDKKCYSYEENTPENYHTFEDGFRSGINRGLVYGFLMGAWLVTGFLGPCCAEKSARNLEKEVQTETTSVVGSTGIR